MSKYTRATQPVKSADDSFRGLGLEPEWEAYFEWVTSHPFWRFGLLDEET